MTRFYVEREPGLRESIGALAVALGVAAATFYLVRTLLSREAVESRAPAEDERPALPPGTPSEEA